MVDRVEDQPPGWGNDELTKFLDAVRHNQLVTFRQHPMAKKIVAIDELFSRVLKPTPVNPRPQYPMNFMLRAHSTYRAAAGTAMAGQAYETNPLLRSCIESTAYGVFIGDDIDRIKTWLGRHDVDAAGKDGKAAVRKMFQQADIKAHLETMSKPLAEDYSTLYEMMIDQGGHPNERGMTFNTQIVDKGDRKEIRQAYLHGPGLPMDLAMTNMVRVGMWVLHVFRIVYQAKFELLGVSAALEELRKNP